VARVVALILHAPAPSDAGPLERTFDAIRRANAKRHAAGFAAAGAEPVIDDQEAAGGFAERVRETVRARRPDGLVVIGSGSLPLTNASDWSRFVAVAGGAPGRALANNRFSADAIAIAGAAVLADLPDLASDNGLPRWLAERGVAVEDLRGRWRLQLDLDTPLDALLLAPDPTTRDLAGADIDAGRARATLARVATIARDSRCELVVAGRASGDGVRWLERRTASRTRALIEERGFRTRRAGQRPVRSALGLLLDRDGAGSLGATLAGLGDAALVDTRVLLAHRFGADEAGWPRAEDRFASDLLLAERVADPWLRALTASARDAPIPIVLGGHTLVGPGLRLALRKPAAWT
jgi:CTP:molybdopterin cytidylyltransferase MocA